MESKEGPPQESASDFKYGKVKLFSLERGYGFISCGDAGDIYVARRDVERPKGLLRAGDRVRFLLGKNRHAEQVCKVDEKGRLVEEPATVSGRATETIDTIVEKAREITLKAVDGKVKAHEGTPLHVAQTVLEQRLAKEELRIEDSSTEDDTDADKQAKRAQAIKRMLEQQAAARDLALAEKRRKQREAEALAREAALRSPSPDAKKELLTQTGTFDESSFLTIQGIVNRPSPTRPGKKKDPILTVLGSVSDVQFPGDEKAAVDAADSSALGDVERPHGLGRATSAPAESNSIPVVDGMDAVISAAVAAATADFHFPAANTSPPAAAKAPVSPPAVPLSDHASKPLTEEINPSCSSSSITPPSPASTALVISTPKATGEFSPTDLLEHGQSTDEPSSIPTSKSALEAEILAVAATLRFHESEITRLRRRMTDLKSARARVIGTDSMLAQLHLNHKVHAYLDESSSMSH